ncbi:hypothetical protein K227x_64230 [Rubripirellula lacrimiformis]|uniref:Uncharacterized protein n=1 Tax=Rubripirellula lacrimiformis TaxID=1930273 RepID=A0A517NLP6_9BACT|nr:hypothetical protein [Rubripirellula lacrimiformis]QDT07993.1 hypothetical protein K227x_64230 [Rubripirellula lacrimiformis]
MAKTTADKTADNPPAKSPAPAKPADPSAAQIITRVCGVGIVGAQQTATLIGPDACGQIEAIYNGKRKDKADAIRGVIGKATPTKADPESPKS